MTPRERVLATFAHEEPDRVPLWCGASAEFWCKAQRQLGLDDAALTERLGDDFRRVWAVYTGPGYAPIQGVTCRTVFGVRRHGMGYGQPLEHPLAGADLRQIEEYAWPDPTWMDPSHIRAAAAPYRDRYAILGGDWSPFWHDAIDLMGMEELMIRMYTEPAAVHTLLGHIVDYYAEVNRRIFESAASSLDVFFIGNDFGGQTGPLIGPAMFREFLAPPLTRLIRLGRSYGLKTQLHCCGGFEPLLPDMIEAGLDAVHAVQPCCGGMDLRRLKERYGRRIVFNGAVDSHHVLIRGTPATVRRGTREVLRIMMPGGGYIAGASHDSILEETPVENVLAMVDTVMEEGVYARP
jgi:uroporphyrinogen decarboxylase